MQTDWEADWIGKVVGSYRLLRILGRGGMGVVFLAEHVRMERKAAVKILHPTASQRPDVGQRLRAEARAMARLSHPGIVAILDQDTLPDGTGFLVMEYLPGESLREVLRKSGGAQSLDSTVSILWQCASAMTAAHSAGVIHRDLSPANVFCLEAADAQSLQIKILDFGLARLYSLGVTSNSSQSTTRDGAVLGTLKYMAPEQCIDAHSASEPADVYSLGAIGYELLAGKPPFVAASGWDLIEQHLREPPPPLPAQTAMGASIPTELRTLLGEMLAKSPLVRPSMQQVAERLSVLLPLPSPLTRSSPRLAPTSSRAQNRRQQLVRISVAAAMVALLGTVGGVGVYAQRQKRSATLQRKQTLTATAEILSIIRRTLRPMPGASAASQGLLELTGRQLTTLLEQLPEDMEVREALVRLHSLRGDFARHHGGLQNARSEYEEAISGAKLLLQRNPTDRGYRLLLATAHDGLGDALEQVADLESARQHYEAALAIRLALKKESPKDPQLHQEVVASHLLLGDLAQAQGKQRSALAAYEQAMTMLEPLWKSDPDNKGYRWQMCGVQYRMSQTLLHLGRSIDSLALAERALELLGRISPTDQQGSSYHVLSSRILQMYPARPQSAVTLPA